jgi:hypothetical protein
MSCSIVFVSLLILCNEFALRIPLECDWSQERSVPIEIHLHLSLTQLNYTHVLWKAILESIYYHTKL